MNDFDQFDDPAFVHRVRDWATEQRGVRAPDHLVGSIMVDVVAAPRRSRRWPLPDALRLQGVAAYGALTAVIAVGVTIGILFASAIDPEVGTPTDGPSGSPRPTPTIVGTGAPTTPGTVPSPVSLGILPDLAFAATAVAMSGDSVWAVDRTNLLAELDPASGAILRSVSLPRAMARLLVTADSVWAASPNGPLVRVDRASLAITEVGDAVGVALAEGPGAIWLGAEDAVIRVDPATSLVSLRVPVANRSAVLGLAVSQGNPWVATRTAILRLDPVSGVATGSISGDGSGLVADGTWLWAIRGTELLRIDPGSVAIAAFTPGMPGSAIAQSDGVVWVAGPPTGLTGVLIGFEPARDAIVYRAALDSGVASLAVGAGTIWLAGDEDGLLHRLAAP